MPVRASPRLIYLKDYQPKNSAMQR